MSTRAIQPAAVRKIQEVKASRETAFRVFTDLGGGLTRVEFEHRGLENLGEGGDAARVRMDGGWGLILSGFVAAAEGEGDAQ